MKRPVILLAVLALCLPANGAILVYRVSGSLVAIDRDTADVIRVQLRGYLVADIDCQCGESLPVSGFPVESALILYGTDDGTRTGNPVQKTTYHIVDDTEFLAVSRWYDVWALSLDAGLGKLKGIVDGKTSTLDIGCCGDCKVHCVRSLSGRFLTNGDWFLFLHSLIGSGRIAARMDYRLTRDANTNGDSLIDVVEDIEQYLDGKDYQRL